MNTPCDTSTLPAGADIARAFMSTRLGRQPQARKDPRTCAMHFRQHRPDYGCAAARFSIFTGGVVRWFRRDDR
jgi:hypothetical protein